MDLNNRCWHCGHAKENGTLCCGAILSNRKVVIVAKANLRGRSIVVLQDTRFIREEPWTEYVCELYEGAVLADTVRIMEKRFPDYHERMEAQVQDWLTPTR